MSKVTATEVSAVLSALAEEYLVDIQAVHNKDGYWLEFFELSSALLTDDHDWLYAIAESANERL